MRLSIRITAPVIGEDWSSTRIDTHFWTAQSTTVIGFTLSVLLKHGEEESLVPKML